ncbi:MAG: PQQ-binding-like beta-propeller repeat protein, partial [Planctomycetes bacterium]|nr:PQQ-binding-like beta-propeller repeat protein [Planctomycetota bacterium]
MRPRDRRPPTALFCVLAALPFASLAPAQSPTVLPPTQWSAFENVKWRTGLAVRDYDRPVVHGSRVFVSGTEGKTHAVSCLDRRSGQLLWVRKVPRDAGSGTQDAATPALATGDDRVVLWHGSGLAAFDFHGDLVWSRGTGATVPRRTAPVLAGERVFVHTGGASGQVLAWSASDGKELWRVDAPRSADNADSWTSPVVASAADGQQVICAFPSRVVAYDAATGVVRWWCPAPDRRRSATVPCHTSPLLVDGLCVVWFEAVGSVLGVRIDGRGELGAKHVAWRRDDLPLPRGTPVAAGNSVLVPARGVVCFDARTGATRFTAPRVLPNGGSLSVARDVVYASEGGDRTAVLAITESGLQSLADNAHEGGAAAAPICAAHELFLRTKRHLLCVAEPPPRPLAWNRFRGPNGSGIAVGDAPLPSELGPNTTLWKCPVGPGHSSPCVFGDAVFLTCAAGNRLETWCIDRVRGTVRWRTVVGVEQLEKVHRVNSAASPTPTTDGERVYVYFGSFGLLCYDVHGNERWRRPLPQTRNQFGTASSPILAGPFLILLRDADRDSFLEALEPKTGKTVWKVPRRGFVASWSTPVLWRRDRADELVVYGAFTLTGYDLRSGAERWSVPGLADEPCITPVLGGGRVYVTSYNMRINPEVLGLPTFAKLLAECDRDGDGRIDRDEAARNKSVLSRSDADGEGDHPLRMFFRFLDADRDG